MIEDLLIWKFVAEHPHCTRANSNPAFSIVCAPSRQLHPVQDLDVSRVTNAVMLLTSNSKQFRLSSSEGFPDR